jgi:8-oxo-dGTP pyrophosphatase MutT (NUDIX family)
VAIWYGNLLLFIQRHEKAKNYPNYLEFPGGKADPTDRTMLTSVLRELQEELGTSILPYLEIFTTPTIQHVYRMTRKGNAYRGWNVQTNLFEASIQTHENVFNLLKLRTEKISETNPDTPPEHHAFLLMTPEEMIRRHNNNRGARVHRGTSIALPYLVENGNPFMENIR